MHPRVLGRGYLIGTSEQCYRVLGAPQNRNIYTIIAGFLAGDCGEVTRDLCSLAFSCGFLHFWTRIFSQVDTPSLAASAHTPAGSSSASTPPEDVEFW